MKKALLTVVAVMMVAAVTAQKSDIPRAALKSNLLSLPLGSINLGTEMRISSTHWTLATDVTFTVLNFWGDVPYGQATLDDRTRPEDISGYYTNGWSGFIEARYYFKQAMRGHHLGLYAMGGRYGRAQSDDKIIGIIMTGGVKARATDAYETSVGLSYGYSFLFNSAKNSGWGMDLYIGGGLLYSQYITGLFYEQNDLRTSSKDALSWTLMKTGIALTYTF